MDVKSKGTMAAVGLILRFIPFVNFVGLVLFLAGMYGLSKATNDNRIFNYALAAFLLGLLGAILGMVVLVSWMSIGFTFMGHMMAAASIVITSLLVLASQMAAYYFNYKLYSLMFERFGVEIFKSAASFYKWGAILVIVGLGFLLGFIGQIMAIIGLFNLPEGIY